MGALRGVSLSSAGAVRNRERRPDILIGRQPRGRVWFRWPQLLRMAGFIDRDDSNSGHVEQV